MSGKDLRRGRLDGWRPLRSGAAGHAPALAATLTGMDPMGSPAGRRWQATRPGVRPPREGAYVGAFRLTPTRVTLAVALGGSLLFLLYGIIVRDETQIPMLCAGFAVLGIVFLALAVAGAIGTYREGQGGRGGQAFAFALAGGLAALVSAGSFATAVVLALVWKR